MVDELSVEYVDLEPFRVAYLTYRPEGNPLDMFGQVKAVFEKVTDWAVGHGLDLEKQRLMGIPVVEDGILVSYDCCMEVPGDAVEEGVLFKMIPGGRYCVLVMSKDSEVISKSIARFYDEYLPQHKLIVDESRPVLELYTRDLMEYCVPVAEHEG